MEQSVFNLFRVPQVSAKTVQSTLIGILDASGSMSSCWEYAAKHWNNLTEIHKDAKIITFSSIAKERNLPITSNINNYDCCSTNICSGFIELNKLLKMSDTKENITVIFISDGQDDNASTLSNRLKDLRQEHGKKINFISVGVGSGFPTFVAMDLRDIYHNGEPSIPPVFLVSNTCSDEDWKGQFEQIDKYLDHSSKVPVTPNVLVLPWLPEAEEIYENSWVLSSADKIVVNSSVEIHKVESLSHTELIQLSRGWLSELQLSSLKKKAKDDAAKALSILKELKNRYLSEVSDEIKQKLSFNERILRKYKSTVDLDIQVFFKAIKEIADDQVLSQLSESEAAKRLAIGTQVGKYHNSAINMRGITVNDYLDARKYFIEVLGKTTFEGVSDQEVSVFSQQNQKEVFQEKDLVDGLMTCQNQYDLVENFPLVGHAIQIKRCDGAMINPFLVKIVGIAKHHKVVDTVSLHQVDGNQLEMKIGDSEEERANAVLPLFTSKDADLSPLLNSKLFNILMTFNVMGNADTCFESAYLALLANVCLYLLTQTASEWRSDTLNLIGSTISITYANKEGFKKYSNTLIENPRIATVTESPSIETKCEDLSKAIVTLFYLVWSKQLESEEKIQEILHAIYADEIGRSYPSERQVEEFFKVEIPEGAELPKFEAEEKKVIEEIGDFKKYFTKYELKKEIEKKVDSLDLKLGFEVSATFNIEECKFITLGRLSRQNLNQIFSYFLPGKVIPHDELIVSWIVHASKFRNSYERNTAEIRTDTAEILKDQAKLKERSILKNNTIAEKVSLNLVQKFDEFITETHYNVIPMTVASLNEFCGKVGLDSTQFQFNGASNLLTNACLSQDCPFYMKPTNQLAQHLESDIGRFPAFHKTIKLNPTLTPEEVFEKIKNGEGLTLIDGKIPINMISNESKEKSIKEKEKYLAFIEKVKKSYVDIPLL